jgi:integrase
MKATINNSLLTRIKPQAKYYDIWDDKLGGFHLRVNPTGKMVYRCAYIRGKVATIGKAEMLTPAQARDLAKQVLGDAAVGIYPDDTRHQKVASATLRAYLEGEYHQWRLLNRKDAKSDLERLKINFINNFGNYPLSEISPLLIEKWRSKRLSNGIKPSTVNRDINILRSALSKAIDWGLIKSNPLSTFKPLKTDKSAKVRYLDKEEVLQLRRVLNERESKLIEERNSGNGWRRDRGRQELSSDPADYMKPLILLSMNTGLRRGEILSLTWGDIDFTNAIITVTGDIAKSGKTRHIPLNAEALAILQQWHKRTRIYQELVFPGKNGKKLKSVKRAWAGILGLAKIKNFRWHDLRHHFASKLVMASVDLNTVRELLGHADMAMTLRYAHLAPEHKANAVARLVEAQAET